MHHKFELKTALIISIAAHTAILTASAWHLNFYNQDRMLKAVRVSYIKSPSARETLKKLPKQTALQKNRYLAGPAAPVKLLPPPSIHNNLITNNAALLRAKPDFTKAGMITPASASGTGKKIGLESVMDNKEINRINSPSYISYYQIIREKIRRCAYQSYTRQDAGEIYLSFVISSNGELNNLKVVDERSVRNDYLRSIALQSVKEASPYPVFPKDLEYPQLSFNVIISFEIE
jgi:outer membrane biosynthesis protein TonB